MKFHGRDGGRGGELEDHDFYTCRDYFVSCIIKLISFIYYQRWMIIVFVWHLAEKSIPKLNLLVTRSSSRSHINLPAFCRMKLLQMNVALLLEMFKARDKCLLDVIYLLDIKVAGQL